MSNDWRKPLFYVAALYDGLFGLLFLFFWRDVFAHFGYETQVIPKVVDLSRFAYREQHEVRSRVLEQIGCAVETVGAFGRFDA